MKELTVFARLGLGYLAILLIVFTLGIYATLKLGQMSQIISSISSIDKEIIETADRLRNEILSQRGFERKYFVSKDEDFYSQFEEIGKYIDNDFNRLYHLVKDTEKEEAINRIWTIQEQYRSLVLAHKDMIEKGVEYKKNESEKEKQEVVSQQIQGLENVARESEKEIDRKIAISKKTGVRASSIIAAATIFGFFTAILIAFFNAQTINRPLVLLMNGIREIAKGKFEKRLKIEYPPEIRELAEAFNDMTDRLKEIDEMKTDLISQVSHELRTPLAIIKESASLLAPNAISSISETRRCTLVEIIGEECERLIGTVNRILDLSRMEAGMIDYHMNKVNISSLLDRSVSSITPILDKKGIKLDIRLAKDLPPAMVDSEKIFSALHNLLENAVKFTPDGGEIIISGIFRNKKISKRLYGKEGAFVEISISDSGCGIAKENLTEIFNKFKTLHAKGTGLGLYIAKHIINAHGGEIWVKSIKGKGSTFSFTMPAYL